VIVNLLNMELEDDEQHESKDEKRPESVEYALTGSWLRYQNVSQPADGQSQDKERIEWLT
jgi:hypothetical protein